MEKPMEKAAILVEALPYIKRFHGKTMVIKYGGSTIADQPVEKNFTVDIVLMKFVGMNPVIVHGGGPRITEALKKKGKGAQFVHGLRVTDEEDIEVVREILGAVNQDIVSLVNEAGGKGLGLKDIIKARRYPPFNQKDGEIDIGFVGEVQGINPELFSMIDSEKGAIPLINPLGVGEGEEHLNVNADEAAATVAVELKAEKFVILTDVPGIMRNWEDKDSLLSTLKIEEAEGLINEGVVMSGMIPKVKACIKALKGGVGKVHIIDGRVSHSILLEIFTDKGIGTQIMRNQK
ncbi:acetylglutamate kinase [bacterium]|nr:acetylglutamate kinase [bacterium]